MIEMQKIMKDLRQEIEIQKEIMTDETIHLRSENMTKEMWKEVDMGIGMWSLTLDMIESLMEEMLELILEMYDQIHDMTGSLIHETKDLIREM